MAVATEYKIKLSCGHTETRDLSDQPAHNRKSYASWLSKKGSCHKCFIKNNQAEIEAKRLEVATSNMQKFELQDLEGTERQQHYGLLVRDRLLVQAIEHFLRGEEPPFNDDEFENRILEPARRFSHAGWWMDNKDTAPDELLEMFDSFRTDPSNQEGVNENPF
ncbi:hypothetical protein [Rothia sp. P4278]|uniref:hypothetical protein n=1 Tax=Rothia sp. P4278 TaxID=3402658 RepID=UPI003AE22547